MSDKQNIPSTPPPSTSSSATMSLQNPNSNLHEAITRDIVTVLVGALTALDIHTEGHLTQEFSTILASYMMEELEGFQ